MESVFRLHGEESEMVDYTVDAVLLCRLQESSNIWIKLAASLNLFAIQIPITIGFDWAPIAVVPNLPIPNAPFCFEMLFDSAIVTWIR